jgi:acetylornithine deacetylase
MDTVFIEGMSFKPQIKKDRLYGPGACDAKGSLASMMNALKIISILKERKHDIWFLAVVSEEIFHLGITRFLKDFRSFDACVIGEPSRLNIGTAHKGFIRLKIKTYGKSAHGATPELGINAVYIMNEIITEIKDVLIPSLKSIRHEGLGSPTINLGRIDGGINFNLVPDSCTVLIDRRTLPGEDAEEVLNTFRETVKKITLKGPDMKAEILDDVLRSPSLETGSSERIVQAAQRSVNHVMGNKRCFGFPYVTDGGLVAAEGIPTIILGPGDAGNCHVLEEYIDLPELEQASEIYRNIYLNY